MVTIDANARAVDGITLVTLRLTGDGVTRRVRLEHRLDGPVWPPRREGVPEDGWDETGYEGIVPASGTVPLGYATPASPADDPVEITESQPIRGAETPTETTDPASVLRHLGEPGPPREAVPLPAEQRQEAISSAAQLSPDSATADGGAGECAIAVRQDEPIDDSGHPPAADRSADPVAAWFDRVEDRLAAIERLDGIESVPDATAAVRSAGGLAASRRTVRASEADRRRLLAVAARARRLANRIEATEPPLETLERLA